MCEFEHNRKIAKLLLYMILIFPFIANILPLTTPQNIPHSTQLPLGCFVRSRSKCTCHVVNEQVDQQARAGKRLYAKCTCRGGGRGGGRGGSRGKCRGEGRGKCRGEGRGATRGREGVGEGSRASVKMNVFPPGHPQRWPCGGPGAEHIHLVRCDPIVITVGHTLRLTCQLHINTCSNLHCLPYFCALTEKSCMTSKADVKSI